MILGILQARTSSSRLPGKVLRSLSGRPMLERQIERLLRARALDRLIVATSDGQDDDPIAVLCDRLAVACFRGSLEDVLDRFYRAAAEHDPEHIVRLTGDCPLCDPELIDRVIAYHLKGDFDYVSNALDPTFPDGLDVEIMRYSCLKTAWREAVLPSHCEHVTPFIYTQPHRFRLGEVRNDSDLSALRWTVDEPEDFDLVERIYAALLPAKPDFGTRDILALLEAKPELRILNRRQRNEGYLASLERDKEYIGCGEGHMRRYRLSEEMLDRALRTIPLGSQTFSKSLTQYPRGVSPFFITRGAGSHVWDVDGNEYVDFVNGLAAITLGYADPDVNAAVARQLHDGVIFTLPHPLEITVAEKIVEMVPCAEMVRFGKNGSDATSGAIRLARAYTGRDHVAVCGYHGWQDWYIGSTARNLGVPAAVRELTHTFTYNDLDSLRKLFEDWQGQIAAVILEPMNAVSPAPGFLQGVRDLTRERGSILVFDETITGFRFAPGGAQEHFGVIPDLATFGKGLANGYPVSAVAGRAQVMRLMEKVFFSFTFGGELLSLAAASATLDKLARVPVIPSMRRQGQKILDGVRSLVANHGVGDLIEISGDPVWTFLRVRGAGPYTEWQIKTLLLQEIFERGILMIGTHNMSYAHSDADVARLLDVYDEVFPLLRQAVNARSLAQQLRCRPLEPLFKVR